MDCDLNIRVGRINMDVAEVLSRIPTSRWFLHVRNIDSFEIPRTIEGIIAQKSNCTSTHRKS